MDFTYKLKNYKNSKQTYIISFACLLIYIYIYYVDWSKPTRVILSTNRIGYNAILEIIARGEAEGKLFW